MNSDSLPSPDTRRRLRVHWAFWLLAPILLCTALGLHTWYLRPFSIDWFFTRVTVQALMDDPESLTTLHVLERFGIRGHNGRLSDVSFAAQERAWRAEVDALATLRGYDLDALDTQQRITYAVLETELRERIAGYTFRYHRFPLNQLDGMHVALPEFLTSFQQIHDATDAEHYLQRLAAFPARFTTVRTQLEMARARGIRPPRFMVDAVLQQLRAFRSPTANKNTLYADFAQKLADVPAAQITPAERQRLLAGAEHVITNSVYPAYDIAIDWFSREQPALVRNDGAWAQPDGARYYAYCIELHTNSRASSAQLHEFGLREVSRLGARMDELLRKQGLVDGTIGERMRELAASPEQQYPDSDAGRAAILGDYKRLIREALPVLARQFGELPKARIEVRPVPAYSEASAPVGYYYPPALDGSTPGLFYVNLGTLKDLPRYTVPTLTYHEAVPGHHFQIALAQERATLPLLRRLAFSTAYAEGWALYAEQLAAELGLVRSETDELGRLQSEMFRAVRLVVDTGLHAERWSREHAIAYMIDQTGMGDREVQSEIERYLVDPGQALAYKVGMQKIIDLRARARARLGPRFELRAFHTAVLKEGSLPLPALEQAVDAYIARTLGSVPQTAAPR